MYLLSVPKHKEMQAWFSKSWPQGEYSLLVLQLEMLVELCVILHTAS
jgi:hypothetical protein